MSLTISTKTVLSAAVAGITLLTLTATPTLASHIPNNTQTTTTASSPTNEAKLAQEQTSQTTAQTNQTPPQPSKMGCSCCKDMMKNKPEMRNNMPGMTNS